MKKHYSPQLDRELIRELYFEAKARGVPMTSLANRLIRDGLELRRLLERTCAARCRPDQLLLPLRAPRSSQERDESCGSRCRAARKRK